MDAHFIECNYIFKTNYISSLDSFIESKQKEGFKLAQRDVVRLRESQSHQLLVTLTFISENDFIKEP